jgi:hypothetical protein
MKDDQSAFPVSFEDGSVIHGMTLRDYFAAKAMQALIMRGITFQTTPVQAYQMADQMIKEREQS